ncbi:hypothetical protein ACFY05_05805 [Microtetraspora fusca]|uniref:Uncharacterized protein n=1 Tax=Microtetraspora fusca TaxID=1997 RepID=A0ABW6V2S9_MICFU
MILISAALVLVAIGLLIAGVVLAKPFLVMWSIVVSVLSAVCLLIGAMLRRHELFPAGGRAAAEPVPAPQGPAAAVPQMAHAGVPGHPGMPGQVGLPGHVGHPAFGGPPAHPVTHPMMGVPAVPPPGAPVPHAFPQQRPPARPATAGRELGPDVIVLVIPGRKRFHLADCRQLQGREAEELTHEEAREEGFTPCTACVPEAVARVAADTEENAGAGDASGPAADDTMPGLTRPRDVAGQSAADGGTAGDPVATEVADDAEDTTSAAAESTTIDDEPVDPAETTDPGRAGSAEPAGSATVTMPRSFFDPAVRPGEAAGTASPDVVMVMTGTRRYHRAGCPLIKAAPQGGLETMTTEEAEDAGLTPCSICAA